MGDPNFPSVEPPRDPAEIEREKLGLEIPSREHLPSLERKELADMFVRNNHRLIARVNQLGPENIPYFGLHGTGDADKLADSIAKPGNQKTFEVVSVLQRAADPVTALVDLYDVIGGDKPYFRNPGSSLLVMEMEGKGGQTIGDVWGESGEFKNWPIAQPHQGLSEILRYFQKTLGVSLSPEDIQVLDYFERTATKQVRPHAEKSTISNSEFHDRLLATIPVAETAIYLDTSINWFSAPVNYERGAIAEMLYVQSVTDRLLALFEERKKKRLGTSN